MKIRLFFPAFDPGSIAHAKDGRNKLIEISPDLHFQGTDVVFDPPLQTGPVSARVAMLDFDPRNGSLCEGLAILPPEKPGQKMHQLGITREELIENPNSVKAVQALCFGTVIRTIERVERRLGRSIKWAFDSGQLLVVPRAGYSANAFYERRTHSLQFFFLTQGEQSPVSDSPAGDLANGVYTALSPHIVAHETAHALIDGYCA